MSNVDLVLNQARAWIGCKGSNGSHKQIIDVYNAYTPLPRRYKVKYTDNWCATYVSACAIKAGLANIIPIECSCGNMITLAKNMGIWEENGNITPTPGDIIIYDWDEVDGWPEHTGLVETVSGNKETVVEGNKSNAVGRRTLTLGDPCIRGYIRPRYDGATATQPSQPSTPSTGTETSQSTSGFTTGTYTITASDLIVRNEPGGTAVGYSGLTADGKKHDTDKDGALNKGTRITVKEVRTVGSNIWGRCPSGWVCLKKGDSVYAVKDGSSSASTGSSSVSSATKALGKYEVTASDLSVRTGPGTNYRRKTYSELTTDAKNHDYDKDGCINKGTRVTVKEWQNGWARIPSGWVSGDYLKKV